MAMHEIESLVEDSVLVVAQSKMPAAEKRNFLYNLYHFQAMYDTGYTHFRVIDLLLEMKFVYRIPVEKHPDYKNNTSYFNALDLENSHWLPTEIGKKYESVYAKNETDGIFLYADAGSVFWQRLCQEKTLSKTEHQPPQKFKVAYLIYQLLEEAKQQKNIHVVRDWYACLVNMIGVDIGEEDGFPKAFLKFIATEEASAIRKIGASVNPFAKANQNDNWGYLARPVLKDIEKEENDIERLFCIKWLLDFKSDEEKIKADYRREITPDPKKEAKLQIIPNAAMHHLGENWELVWNQEYEYGYKWLYHHQLRGTQENHQDTDLHLYLFIDAKTNDIDKILYPKIGVQSGLLNRWQGRNVIHKPEYIHFLETFFLFIPDAVYDANKSLHKVGGWKFSLKSSEKVLKTHVDNFFECFRDYAPKLLVEFEKPLFNGFQMSFQEALNYRGIIQQTHRFFLNKIEVYLVYAIYYFEKGEKDKAYELANQAKKMAEEKKHPIAKEWIASAESILAKQPKLNELLSFERRF